VRHSPVMYFEEKPCRPTSTPLSPVVGISPPTKSAIPNSSASNALAFFSRLSPSRMSTMHLGSPFRNGSCGNGVGRSYYGAEYQAGTPVESSGGIRSACSAELLWHYRLTRPIAPNAAKSGGPNNSVSFPKPRLRRQHPTVKSPQRKMAQPTD